MRIAYCCDADRRAYEQYYANQSGNGMPVFYGARMQRGHGIGSIFGSLFRSVLPIFKRVAPAIGKKAIQTGLEIVDDVASGQSLKEAAKSRVMGAFKEGINKTVHNEIDQSGSGTRRGRKRRQKNHSTNKTNKRIKRSDIFTR